MSIIQSGHFTADGSRKRLAIRSDVDWMRIYNFTNIDAQTNGYLGEMYWQRGMENEAAGAGHNEGIAYLINATGNYVVDAAAQYSGITLLDTTASPLTSPIALTGTTDVVAPRVTAATASLKDGDVVRMYNVTTAGGVQLSGLSSIDFQITVFDANNFDIAYNMATAPGGAGTAGFWRRIKYDPIYYPRRRYIVNVVTATGYLVVHTSVDHGLTAGQKVRLKVPTGFGMIEANDLIGTITAVTAGTMTLDISAAGMTAFAFPTTNTFKTPAEVIPLGEDTSYAVINSLDVLADRTYNTGIIGVELGATAHIGAAGDNTNSVYWIAGKSDLVNNE